MGRRTELSVELLDHDVDVSWWVTPDAYEDGQYQKLHRALRHHGLPGARRRGDQDRLSRIERLDGSVLEVVKWEWVSLREAGGSDHRDSLGGDAAAISSQSRSRTVKGARGAAD